MDQYLVLHISMDSFSIDSGRVFTWNGHLTTKKLPLKFVYTFDVLFHYPHNHVLGDLLCAHSGFFYAEID